MTDLEKFIFNDEALEEFVKDIEATKKEREKDEQE
jgi:hypothetical protein